MSCLGACSTSQIYAPWDSGKSHQSPGVVEILNQKENYVPIFKRITQNHRQHYLEPTVSAIFCMYNFMPQLQAVNGSNECTRSCGDAAYLLDFVKIMFSVWSTWWIGQFLAARCARRMIRWSVRLLFNILLNCLANCGRAAQQMRWLGRSGGDIASGGGVPLKPKLSIVRSRANMKRRSNPRNQEIEGTMKSFENYIVGPKC